MGRHSKDWNDGYQAAIEAIKKALQGQSGGNGGGGEDGLPSDMTPPPGQGNGNGSGSSSGNDNKKGTGSDTGSSRTDKNNPNQGTVRPEDCMDPSGALDGCPSTPGGMISKSDGDKLAEQEGYSKEGGNESTVEREWKDSTIKVTQKHNFKPGTAAGNFMAKLEGLYKTHTDWKKVLKQVIGQSIAPEDKRQALANKNVLVSQDRFIRTDKDRLDSLDYMMVWVDSSCSMTDEQLKMCLSEVYAIALAKKPIKLVVVQCDTKIQEIKEFRSLKEFKNYVVRATVKGRGGTELAPCWDLLRKDPRYNRRKPDVVVVFTDGGLTQYKRDLRTMKNLVWCIIDNPGFNLQYKDANTKCVHIKSSTIK